MENQDPNFSTPAISGLYHAPPYHYLESPAVMVQFETDPTVLRTLVPEPLVPNEHNHMFVSVSDFVCSGFGRYLELHVFTHAWFRDRLVNYSIYLILDNDVATGAGREIWGFPKKLGRLTLDLRDDVVRTTVERGGIVLVDAAVQIARPMSPDEIKAPAEWVTRKILPGVSADAPAIADQLVATTLTDVTIRDIHAGPATLTWGASPADRLSVIPVVRVLGGFSYRTGFVLGDGAVVHNYLT